MIDKKNACDGWKEAHHERHFKIYRRELDLLFF